jgi:hypothetical protein
MGKYDPIRMHLAAVGQNNWTASFRDIEAIVGSPLPKSAFVHREWWANDTSHVQAKAWLEAGWRSEPCDLNLQTIRFSRR